MKVLVISNFRVGSWWVHDMQASRGNEPVGELLSNFYQNRDEKIQKWKDTADVVGKLHPIQLDNPDLWDELIGLAGSKQFVQRRDTKAQCISYAIATNQYYKKSEKERDEEHTKNIFLRDREPYTGELTIDDLDLAYTRLKQQQDLIESLYSKHGGNVLTLEDDLPRSPYQNQYDYNDVKWNPPSQFEMLNG